MCHLITDVIIQNVGSSIEYTGVNLIIYNNMLTIDIKYRILKFNIAAYCVLLNTNNLTEVIIKSLKVFVCNAIWNWWCFNY